ncbi:OTU-like cysteine protease family protein [Zea mays]|uniref:ubiquitinyl hydrolase 1 n=1 Tax=Zea mays TaxID=4577 RepID=A0A1D6EBG9_MAIZE|nr:OTU-like cysteine protease family protein [Zea mays]
MTRIFVQRGTAGSSSSSGRSGSQSAQQPAAAAREELPLQPQPQLPELLAIDDVTEHLNEGNENNSSRIKFLRTDDTISESSSYAEERAAREKPPKDDSNVINPTSLVEEPIVLHTPDQIEHGNSVPSGTNSSQMVGAASHPPPPPAPPPKSLLGNSGLWRMGPGSSNSVRIGSPRRPVAWPPVAARTSASGSRPSSPRSLVDGEGYNSADEQGPCYASSYDDSERERMFEHDLRRVKGLEIRKTAEDGNCLFRAVADQVYGDAEAYDMARQMCVDYMVEPINIFQGSYNTDTPPIRLSYHHGNHYNSVVDPRRQTIGAGLGFSSFRGTNVDRDQVKAAIKAQQDQQIDNALMAEGRFYSDLELTEREIERMVMEASRSEYLAKEKKLNIRESSTSGAEPSSSAAISGSSRSVAGADRSSEDYFVLPDTVLTRSMQLLLAMGFGYNQVMEAYSIFGEDVDSMVCYLVETGGASAGGSNRRKGKAAE